MRLLLWGLLALLLTSSPADAHDREIVACDRNLKVEHVTKLKEVVNGNGTLSEAYDRNGDGQIDIEAVSYLRDGEKITDAPVPHFEHPFLWIVDLDFDGTPDAVYVDRHGRGQCEDIYLYRDLTQPHSDNPDEREQGRI